jgi:acyl-coenzyme A synthetase/AMP-(fatty) acid ligase
MKRAVLCVCNPQDYIPQLTDYSIMIINPDSPVSRIQYLLDCSDYSLLITNNSQNERSGGDYHNERLFWYTSGTTGDSKFYSFSQQQLDTLCRSICNDYAITANDRYVGVMGLWHAHGQALYWATKSAGCETHFTSIKELKNISQYQPTFISAIPNILKTIQSLTLTSLRFIRSGSALLPNELYNSLKQKFQVPVIEYFGMTEAMSHVFTNPLTGTQRVGTVGLPTAGVNAQVKNGHLWLQSSNAYTTDWFDTGDLAEQDEYGYYRILGRSVDRINVKGYKIDPVSIEQQLKEQIPELEDCVIFGQTKLNCIYTGDVDSDIIIKKLISIHPTCRPALIGKHNSIPTPASGKISRTWLKEKFKCV